MTPEDRKTVIEALEVARTACTSSSELREINKALAIMRRDAPRMVYVRDDKGRIIGLREVE